MSNEAIDWAIKQGIKGGAARKLILFLLANRANDQWVCWPGRKRLAEEAGISAAQVTKHLTALEEEGLIRRVPWQREDGGQGSNCYVLGSADVTPYSFSSRGAGHIRAGGYSKTSGTPARKRAPMNPQQKPAENSSAPAAREESRRRSPEKSGETRMAPRNREEIASLPKPTLDDLYNAVNHVHRQGAEAAERQEQMIRSKAPALWRRSVESATEQLRKKQPDGPLSAADVRRLAHQYAILKRDPDWPPWLVGPLLPVVAEIAASGRKAA